MNNRLTKVFARWPRHYWIAATLGLIAGGLILSGLWIWSTYRTISVQRTEPVISPGLPSPTPTPEPPYETLVLLGYGGGGHSGGRLTDTIITVFIDRDRQRITLLSLPRDLWVSLPTQPDQETGWKLNAAYAIGSDDQRYPLKPAQYTGPAGGGELAKFAIEKILGIPVKYFVALDFDGFVRSVDVLGGVEINVTRTFTDPLYPIEGQEENTCGKSPEELATIEATTSAEQAEKLFACRYEILHFERGPQLMSGDTALKYVRSRHSPEAGNDFSRSQRQRELLVAVKNKVLSIGFLPKAITFVNTLAGHLQTDLQIEDFQRLIAEAPELGGYTIVNLALTDKNLLKQGRSANGQFVLLPREGEGQFSAIHSWIEAELATPAAKLQP